MSSIHRTVSLTLRLAGGCTNRICVDRSNRLRFTFSTDTNPTVRGTFNAPLNRTFNFVTNSPTTVNLIVTSGTIGSTTMSVARCVAPGVNADRSGRMVVTVSNSTDTMGTTMLRNHRANLRLLVNVKACPRVPNAPCLWGLQVTKGL